MKQLLLFSLLLCAIALFVTSVVCSPLFSQNISGTTATAPHIRIKLPDTVATGIVWVRYALYGREGGRGSRGETLKLEPNARHYDILAVFSGAPAQEARVVVFVPGCQFGVYDFTLNGSDVEEQFRCESVPLKTVHGFLDPKHIPSTTYFAEKRLDIGAYFTADWVCNFFLQPRRSDSVTGGSCLGSGISLGTVGQFDPADNGTFEITIPDFTRDPVFGNYGRGAFGIIQLSLNEKRIGRTLATIKAADGSELGMNVQVEYRDPVVFTPIGR